MSFNDTVGCGCGGGFGDGGRDERVCLGDETFSAGVPTRELDRLLLVATPADTSGTGAGSTGASSGKAMTPFGGDGGGTDGMTNDAIRDGPASRRYSSLHPSNASAAPGSSSSSVLSMFGSSDPSSRFRFSIPYRDLKALPWWSTVSLY